LGLSDAARSIAELRIEIETLKRLEGLALAIRRSGDDKKWRELATLLGEIFTAASISNAFAEDGAAYDAGSRQLPKPKPSPHQKLVLFTEHRDTLNYLQRLRYLMRDPFCGRICGDVGPDEVSAVEPDDDEGIEQVETDRWDNEQVHGGNVRRVVTQEGSPSLAGWPPSSDHVLGDA
jgi:hypothetical protein